MDFTDINFNRLDFHVRTNFLKIAKQKTETSRVCISVPKTIILCRISSNDVDPSLTQYTNIGHQKVFRGNRYLCWRYDDVAHPRLLRNA